MKLNKLFLVLPLILGSLFANAETAEFNTTKNAIFEFSTEVQRTIAKDLMQASVYSRKTGKSLPELKKFVSENLNGVITQAKQFQAIEIQTDGISNNANYDEKGKVDGWVAEGYITLKSKDFESMAKVLEHLGENVAIANVSFSVSPEKMRELEDEMTLEIIKQFQHKAEVIQKGLSATSYRLVDIQLHTPNGRASGEHRPLMAMAKMANSAESLPLEAGNETISATASGKVTFQ